MTHARALWLLPGLAGLALLAGGCTQDLSKAVDEFVGFSEGKTKDALKPEVKREYSLRSWEEDVREGRSRARVDVEVAPEADAEQVEGWLRDACHDDKLLRKTSVVRVRAWPGKLQALGHPYGDCTFARDGRGWNGTGVGFEEIRVFLPRASELAQAGLEPLDEETYLIVLGVDNMLKRKAAREVAVEQVAERHGIPVSRVQSALTQIEGLNAVLRGKAGPDRDAPAEKPEPSE
ncbi:MAG TPA: hypothetical protein PK668_05595 [Myxococcota bacterium]|nr:hypothetical protein [Myxococcota bacterium]HRY92686.1 hypothetical protein [Myxococcota bacterium]HSA24119.1 hypothetical protein [Myxococcota bacterium]